MADTITKILIRQGTDVQRRTAELTGVVFSSGEPGYCVDTKRLFIGDGSTSGGFAIGIQNLGSVGSLYGNWQNGFSFDAITQFNNKGASIGDIIYDRDTRGLYSLTSVTTFPPLTTDIVKYDFATLINNQQFFYDENNFLNIKNGGVGNNQLSLSIVDGITLFKPAYSSPMSIKQGGVDNTRLAFVPPNTLKGNNSYFDAYPQDLDIGSGCVVGRTNTSQLTAFPFSVILSEATFNYTNGIIVDQAATPPVFKLDETYFTIGGNSILLRKATTVSQAFTVNNNATVNGTFRCTGDIVAYYAPSDANLKENFKQIESPLQKILNITGYSFTWRKGIQNSDILIGRDYGVIAQEVEKELPEVVATREDGTKSVSYIKLIPLLIESIKELKKEIDILKNR